MQEIYRVLRNEPRCTGPVSLLRNVPIHQADGARSARRRCDASVARRLVGSSRWDAELDAEYHRQSVYAPAKVLTLGNITCPAQQFWDAIVYAAPSEIPAALASI